VKARIKTVLFAAGTAAVLVTVASAGGSAFAGGANGLNIRNGVVHACYETRGDASTRGDLKLYSTNKGCKPIAWSIKGPKGDTGPASPGANGPSGPAGAKGDTGAAGANGAAGPQGQKGDKGDKGDNGNPGEPGTNPVGQWGGFDIQGREDTGCITAESQEVWAHDNETRFFAVVPAQDGSGYFVTRYDLKGTYTTVIGAHDPGASGCDSAAFTAEQSGPFNGVWTMKVSIDGAHPVDYNPDAPPPEGSSWDDFLNAVFGVDSNDSHVTTTSYEFDYYNTCGDHWRDSYYNGTFFSSGGISVCPRTD
jgi:hypothetical protein